MQNFNDLKRARRQAAKDDKRINAAYLARCSGVAIDVMDIGKVFAHGRWLVANGANDNDLGEGIAAFVATLAR